MATSWRGEVTTAFDAPVSPGAEASVNLARPFVVLRHPRLQLVYEDDDVIVVNKGYGLLSVSTQSHHKDETAYDILRDYVKRQNPPTSCLWCIASTATPPG